MALSVPIVLAVWGLVSLATSLVAGAWLANLDRQLVVPVVADETPRLEERVAA